jgi:hypothetical protein
MTASKNRNAARTTVRQPADGGAKTEFFASASMTLLQMLAREKKLEVEMFARNKLCALARLGPTEPSRGRKTATISLPATDDGAHAPTSRTRDRWKSSARFANKVFAIGWFSSAQRHLVFT